MKQLLTFLLTVLMSMVGAKTYAYDIAVQNADGVTIYYNYINNGTELEVTFSSTSSSYDYNYTGNVVIPEEVVYMNRTRKVTSIGSKAFYYSRGLTSVTIGNSVTSIGESAFSGLTSVTIGNSVTSIGNKAFYGCNNLKKVIVSDIAVWCGIKFGIDANPLIYAKHLYSDENTEIKDLIIPDNVTSISDMAFEYCSGLTSVTIGNSVTSIGDMAFDNCEGLTSVTIGNSVTSIGYRAFVGCPSLTSIIIPNSVRSIENSAFAYCDGLTSVIIGNSVTSIGDYAFYRCSNLPSVTIPNSVTSIGGCAFEGCSGLTSVTIGNSVTSIDVSAFSGCSGLTSVTIPNSVTNIGWSAFRYCSSLTSVTIGSGVTSIGSDAFNGADIPIIISLIENPFIIEGKTSSDRTFTLNTFNNATLHIPYGTIDKYKATNGWKDFVFIEEETPVLPVTYHLTYYIDGTEYKTFEIEEGAEITPEPDPFKETYKFSGWSEIPETMPNHDVTVTGTFIRYFDVGNLTKAINFVMNNSASAEDVGLYDLNNNEKMDIGDVILIVKFILNNSNDASNSISRHTSDVADLTQYTAAQFEVKTAGNVDLRLVKSMEQTHQLMYQQKDANTYAVVVYSLTNQLMQPENGKIIETDSNSDILSIENVTVATPSEETAYYQTLSATTGVEQIDNENGTAVIYDLKGNRLNSEKALDKGIYIVNGKKTVVR